MALLAALTLQLGPVPFPPRAFFSPSLEFRAERNSSARFKDAPGETELWAEPRGRRGQPSLGGERRINTPAHSGTRVEGRVGRVSCTGEVLKIGVLPAAADVAE